MYLLSTHLTSSLKLLNECSTPFELHDDNYVLKAMNVSGKPQGNDKAHNFPANGGESSSMFQPQFVQPSGVSMPTGRSATSPPLPGIIKARVKHED